MMTFQGIKFIEREDRMDIELMQGKTISFSFVWGGETPIDVTGFDARMQLREAFASTEVVAELTQANSRVSIGGVNGLIAFSMTAADSAALEAKNGVYDIEVVDASGNVHPLSYGKFTIKPEVTK